MSLETRSDVMNTYQFTWQDLGDLALGRPNLGDETSVLAYRLMQFTFKDVLSHALGVERTAELFIESGAKAGREFCRNLLDTTLPLDAFIAQLKERLVEYKVGVMRIEKLNRTPLEMVLTVSEDLDCSGLPIMGETVCDYDEGFIAGIFAEYTGQEYRATEIDCWATGDRTCRFQVKPLRA